MATARAKPKRENREQEASSHSGRLLLRMSPSLHAELAEAADREGQSLNAYITGVLADRDGEPPSAEGAPRGTPSRLIRTAVIADLVLVAIAAVVAIALLVVAWP
jgi:hypothetical protein